MDIIGVRFVVECAFHCVGCDVFPILYLHSFFLTFFRFVTRYSCRQGDGCWCFDLHVRCLFGACRGLVGNLDVVMLVVSCYYAWGVVGWWGPVMHGICYRWCRSGVVRCCGFTVQIVSILVFSPVVVCWCCVQALVRVFSVFDVCVGCFVVCWGGSMSSVVMGAVVWFGVLWGISSLGWL